MFEAPFNETVNLFLDTRARCFCRVLHPDVCQLLYVKTPYLVVPAPLDQQTLDLSNGSSLL